MAEPARDDVPALHRIHHEKLEDILKSGNTQTIALINHLISVFHSRLHLGDIPSLPGQPPPDHRT